MSQWLRAVADRVPRYGSICTGACLLGRAGLLDGRRATTHWSDAARLAAELPLQRARVDAARMRLVFARRFGVTPIQYRESFSDPR